MSLDELNLNIMTRIRKIRFVMIIYISSLVLVEILCTILYRCEWTFAVRIKFAMLIAEQPTHTAELNMKQNLTSAILKAK